MGQQQHKQLQLQLKTSNKKQVALSKNLNRAFSEVQEVLEKDDDDDAPEIVQHSKTLLSQLNWGRLPEQLRLFAGSDGGETSKLKVYAEYRIGRELNESNPDFLKYLTTENAKNVFVENDTKIHMETGNIYHQNVNMRESIYDFLAAQEDQAKKLMLYKIKAMVNFSNYLKEVVHRAVKNDEYVIRTNTTSKFFFHRFNSLRNTHSLHT